MKKLKSLIESKLAILKDENNSYLKRYYNEHTTREQDKYYEKNLVKIEVLTELLNEINP